MPSDFLLSKSASSSLVLIRIIKQRFIVKLHWKLQQQILFSFYEWKFQLFSRILTVDLGTFPRKVMFLLAFSLATLILCVGAISWRYQLVGFLFGWKICSRWFTEKSWMREVSGFWWGVFRYEYKLYLMLLSGEIEYFLL